MSLPEIELRRLVAEANAVRGARATVQHADQPNAAEQQLEARFACRERLAVYGTLAPGRSNYHIVQPLGGSWTSGIVEGSLISQGRGAALGHRALVMGGDGNVDVHVLHALRLATDWRRLDEFEGDEYRRILIPIFSREPGKRLITVANLYAAADLRANSDA